MTDQEFYFECARLLGCDDYEGEPFAHYRRNRWNNRKAGQGRYPGRGIIRIFGNDVHVALTDPELRMIGTKEEVIYALTNK